MRIQRPDREPDLAFRVVGEVGTAGSKVSGVAYRKGPDGKKIPIIKDNGKIQTFTKDSSGAKGKAWRSLVADAGAEAMGGRVKFDGALYVEMTFLRQRNKGHLSARGDVKPSAPLYPSTRPDVLKHARGTEDALSGVVWVDDSRICSGPNEKVFAEPNEPVGAEIRVWQLPTTVHAAAQAEAMSLLCA